MTINKDILRAKAMEMFAIPGHYRLVAEDDTPAGQPVNRTFVWEDPESPETAVEIGLDLATGALVNADVKTLFCKGFLSQAAVSSPELAREMADGFVAHYVREADHYSWIETLHSTGYRFAYREEAGGLPLPYTGCEIVLDQQMENIRYRYHRRVAPLPEWPSRILQQHLIMDQILDQSRMELQIAAIPAQSGDMEAEFRLVYQLLSGMWLIDAVTGEDLYGAEHYALPPSYPLIPGNSENTRVKSESNALLNISEWENLLGIAPNELVLDKTEDDECLYLTYNLISMKPAGPESTTLSLHNYLNNKWAETVKQRKAPYRLEIEKTTGMLLRFHRYETGRQPQSGSLGRKECWQKAERFLGSVFPEYAAWLRLEEPADADHSEERSSELFCLPVYRGDTPAQGELVMVNVNTSTGQVSHYKGTSGLMLQQLKQVSLHPELSPDEALEACKNSLELELKWQRMTDLDNNQFCYRLIYGLSALQDKDGSQAAGIQKQRYVDALTGALV
ncbi:hypothetical protein R70723_15040 [Paenibacillus sp. FSL R7-0273]|uniref:YcdB/YcdC domain-containing protein n=1 Tax=Paenibacillus sp. FSL R7-0273 TaxID=1536772 RepID=UPI0004F6332F|nr:YcdB/YcdC domain-containing protein [Paenibacillus sp. FSL R7-0273]AIQ47050.1 hypothetical protein R70723_15040 [Paenibacillus sp. FSL R7-0273]OMF97195.1 hypothetical protein BK144_00590 [Paenibacillus sp. FSL R7-0273]